MRTGPVRLGVHCPGGFKELVADVGLGRVGIIFGIGVSRLARNNTDWYQLLDLCASTNTLIADSDGVYHPGEFNDRLVLGLKGTMSEAELHLIRSRLTAGLRHKAARGELRQGLPVGFDYDHDGQVVFSADVAVVEAIATVFRRFAELGSARQVLLSLREDGLLLPRRPTRTGRISWAAATYPAVHDFLTNPCYAGAFAFGRNRSEKRIHPDGRVITRTVALPRDEWAVLIPEHHAGFIDWPTYEANTAQLRENWRPPRGSGGGAAREGAALLQGRIRCGRCGRMMQTGYSGTKGNCPRYVCARAKQLYGGENACQSLGGRRLEQRVLAEVFAVLAPAGLDATIQALRDAEAAHVTSRRARCAPRVAMQILRHSRISITMDLFTGRRSEHSRSTWAIRHHASGQELGPTAPVCCCNGSESDRQGTPKVDLTRGGAKGVW
jgi:DNA invertase Pin-like site-specific DNA recombinase